MNLFCFKNYEKLFSEDNTERVDESANEIVDQNVRDSNNEDDIATKTQQIEQRYIYLYFSLHGPYATLRPPSHYFLFLKARLYPKWHAP